jgi:mono/diheme cytochrome c family protein
LAVLAAVVILGLYAIAWHRAIDPIAPASAGSFSPDLIAQGEMLAAVGDCAACHTAAGGQPLAGGYALDTPFGAIYSLNITPDPQTGIGRWSEPAFVRAMRAGVARDGSYLFPAFPYDHFSKVTDSDLHALYAYLMTRAPVVARARDNRLPFPLNLRFLQAGYQMLFLHDLGAYRNVADKSADWNRGAYLAEGLGHCGSCHTPRNALGAERRGAATYGGEVLEDWYAPPLNADSPAPLPWTEEELYTYLRSGVTALHGSAFGSMSLSIHGLSKLPDADVHALAVYFADVDGAAQKHVDTAAVVAKALAVSALGTRHPAEPGAALYLGACASCHYNSGAAPLSVRPELALNTALSAAVPDDLIQVVLRGVGVDDGVPGVLMPGFAQTFSDAQLAQLAAWLRRTRTEQPPWSDLEQHIAAVRKQH